MANFAWQKFKDNYPLIGSKYQLPISLYQVYSHEHQYYRKVYNFSDLASDIGGYFGSLLLLKFIFEMLYESKLFSIFIANNFFFTNHSDEEEEELGQNIAEQTKNDNFGERESLESVRTSLQNVKRFTLKQYNIFAYYVSCIFC